MSLVFGTNIIHDGDPLKMGTVQVEKLYSGTNLVWQNTQLPSVITDFNASDSEVGQITMTWSSAGGIPPATYNLVKDGLEVETNITSPYVYLITGTATYGVNAVNTVGSVPSNTNVGTAIPAVVPITNFAASDDQQGQVTMSWTSDPNSVGHDLYKDGALIANGVITGYVYLTTPATNIYHVVARYANGATADSNTDSGTSLIVQDPAGSIEILATAAWTVPTGYTQVTVCINGGGGGGGSGDGLGHEHSSGGGGGGSGAVTGDVTVLPEESILVTVGAGGAGAGAEDATGGGSSSFASYLSSTGGGAGTNDTVGGAGGSGGGAGGGGSGGNFSGCAGSFTGGAIGVDDGYGGTSGGGGAGGFGNGGNAGNHDSDAVAGGGKGAGGGGGAYVGTGLGGNGSAGRCFISWGE